MPIISTTRISTSVVLRPRLTGGVVQVDLIPRIAIAPEEDELSEREPELVDFRDYQTTIEVAPGGVGRVYGFQGASEEFNRHFLGAKNLKEGSTAIRVKAGFRKPGQESASENKESISPETSSSETP